MNFFFRPEAEQSYGGSSDENVGSSAPRLRKTEGCLNLDQISNNSAESQMEARARADDGRRSVAASVTFSESQWMSVGGGSGGGMDNEEHAGVRRTLFITGAPSVFRQVASATSIR